MNTKEITFGTLEEFIENYNKCTFGLNIITNTKPEFKSKKNSFIGRKVEKITFYKNAMCGCSYQKAIENAIKEDYKDLKGTMLEAVKNAANETFSDTLPWGNWLNYPFIIEHTSAQKGYNRYLRIYNNFKRTKIETFYFIDGTFVKPDTDIYNQLMSELREKKQSAKQAEFGLKQSVVPCAYNINGIIFAQQGNKKYVNYPNVNMTLFQLIKEVFQ